MATFVNPKTGEVRTSTAPRDRVEWALEGFREKPATKAQPPAQQATPKPVEKPAKREE